MARHVHAPGGPSDPTKSSLSRERQRLVTLMQELSFGRIENLRVRNGEPVLDGEERPRVIRTYRAGRALGRRNAPRPQADAADFALRQEVVDFLTWLDRVRDVVVERLEVVDGLPNHWDAEEPMLPA